MREDKRLIDANSLLDRLIRIERGCLDIDSGFARGVRECMHAVISANTEHVVNPNANIIGTSPIFGNPTCEIKITRAIRTCPNCGMPVRFDFGKNTPKNNKGGNGDDG